MTKIMVVVMLMTKIMVLVMLMTKIMLVVVMRTNFMVVVMLMTKIIVVVMLMPKMTMMLITEMIMSWLSKKIARLGESPFGTCCFHRGDLLRSVPFVTV